MILKVKVFSKSRSFLSKKGNKLFVAKAVDQDGNGYDIISKIDLNIGQQIEVEIKLPRVLFYGA